MSSRTRALAKILGRTEKENVTRASLGEGGGASVDVFDTLDSLPITADFIYPMDLVGIMLVI